IFPIMATDYYQGWAKSRLVTPPVTGRDKPDAAVPAADAGTLTDGAVPVFFLDHPVTKKPVVLPGGTKLAGGDALLPAPAGMPAPIRAPGNLDAAVADAERR